jgi:hypothetical protein
MAGQARPLTSIAVHKNDFDAGETGWHLCFHIRSTQTRPKHLALIKGLGRSRDHYL